MTDFIVIYITLINMCTFIAFGLDKSKARRNNFRISERMLLTMAACGGSIGAIIGMQVFHHKTKHITFNLGIPGIIIFHYSITLIIVYWDKIFS